MSICNSVSPPSDQHETNMTIYQLPSQREYPRTPSLAYSILSRLVNSPRTVWPQKHALTVTNSILFRRYRELPVASSVIIEILHDNIILHDLIFSMTVVST